jgi:hypothetical protein
MADIRELSGSSRKRRKLSASCRLKVSHSFLCLIDEFVDISCGLSVVNPEPELLGRVGLGKTHSGFGSGSETGITGSDLLFRPKKSV